MINLSKTSRKVMMEEGSNVFFYRSGKKNYVIDYNYATYFDPVNGEGTKMVDVRHTDPIVSEKLESKIVNEILKRGEESL